MPARINVSRLQRMVDEAEYDRPFEFDELCAAVADSQWGKNLKLKPEDVGVLIVEHNIITKGEKPESTTVVATEDVEPPSVVISGKPDPVPVEKISEKKGKETLSKVAAVGLAAKVVNTYDGPGKGRKQCPSCEKYVGLRTKVCACEHEFVKKSDPVAPKPTKSVTTPTATVQLRKNIRSSQISTPAGEPPAKLAGTSEKEVIAWADAVRRHGETIDKFYTVRALVYWTRYFYEYGSPEFREVKAILESVCGEAAA